MLATTQNCHIYTIHVANKKFELMLTRCAKAYSNSGSVV